MSEVILRVKDLSIGLSQAELLLDRVSFDVCAGETYALVGESGSGKTLSALSIVRLLPAPIEFYQGHVLFDKKDLLRLPEAEVRKVRGKEIGFVFQEPSTALNPVLTVKQQIDEILDPNEYGPKRARSNYIYDLLDSVEIYDSKHVAEQYPHELSGGMKQRIIIALAIARKPRLLIADEPTTALDVTVQKHILELLKTLQKHLKMSMLFISHNLSIVSNIADQMAIMQDGKIVEYSEHSCLFSKLQHPYSLELVKAIPEIGKRSELLKKGSSEQNAGKHSTTTPILEVSHLSVHFPIRSGIFRRITGRTTVIEDVSFSLPKGKTLALVGESGSGKTTVAKAILHLLESYDGTILFEGQVMKHANAKMMSQFRKRVQVVLQDPYASMNPKLTVAEIIQEGLAGLANRKEKQEKTLWLLNEVGLKGNMVERYPHEFSGGQRQRICIARALAMNPEVLICDEPTSALDVCVQAHILDLLCMLQQEHDLSYLLITHDFGVVSYMADEIGVMKEGTLVECAPTQQILNTPQQDYTQTLLAAVPRLQMA